MKWALPWLQSKVCHDEKVLKVCDGESLWWWWVMVKMCQRFAIVRAPDDGERWWKRAVGLQGWEPLMILRDCENVLEACNGENVPEVCHG